MTDEPPAQGEQPADDERGGAPLGRRAFFTLLGGGLTMLAWGGAAAGVFSRGTEALPAGVRRVLPFGSGWRIYWVQKPFPVFDRSTYRLTVDGLVDRPLSLTYDELLAMERTDQVSDFHCVTGWSVEDVGWSGVRLSTLLDAAGVQAEAVGIEMQSMEEPYVDTLTLEQARLEDVLVAYGMGGQPLPQPHGAPVRVVIPRMFGYKGVKWLSRIRLVDRIEDGYWEQRGYDRDAWVDGLRPA